MPPAACRDLGTRTGSALTLGAARRLAKLGIGQTTLTVVVGARRAFVGGSGTSLLYGGPVTSGMEDFHIDDEAFYLLRTRPEMNVLLEAPLPVGDNAGEVHPQAWTYELPADDGQVYRSFVWMQGHVVDNLLDGATRDFILRGARRSRASRRPRLRPVR